MEGKMSRRDSDKQMSPLGFIFLSPAGPNDLCLFGSVSFSPSHTPSLPLFLAMAVIVLIPTLELYIVHPEIQCASPTLMHASITWGSCGPVILIQ